MKKIIMAILKKTFMILGLIILAINSFTSSTLIGEKISLAKFAGEFRSEIKSIQDSTWSYTKIDYKTYDFEDPGLGKVSFSSFSPYFTFMDLNMLDILVDNDNNFLLSDDNKSGSFTNIFTLNFQTSAKQDKASFKFASKFLKISKKFFSEEYLIKQNVTIDLAWEIVSIDLPDESLRPLIKAGLEDFLKKQMSQLIKASIDTDIKTFYDKLNKKNAEINSQIYLVGYSPNIEFTIDISYDKLPQLISPLTNYTLFSRSGRVNGISHNDTLPKFIFDSETSSELAISRELFYDIINLMTKNGVFDYSINNNILFPESDFNLNILSLSNIIPEIADSYSNLQGISVYNLIRNIEYNKAVNDKFLFVASVETQIFEKTKESVIFKFSYTLNLEMKAIVSGTNLNFYIDNVKADNIKIISDEFLIVNIQTLRKYLVDYYNLYFSKVQKFYLFQKPLDLVQYATGISKTAFTEYGFSILFDSKAKYIMKTRIREAALKFLGGH